jgi:IMP dehydrogenase
MNIRAQAELVRRVKRSESGMILDPFTLDETATLADAKKMMRDPQHRRHSHRRRAAPPQGHPHQPRPALRERHDPPVSAVMTPSPLVTAQAGTELAAAEDILQDSKVEKLPVVDREGRLVGLITYKDIRKRRRAPNACKDEFGRLRVGAAVGVTPDLLDRVAALVEAGVDVVSVDTAMATARACSMPCATSSSTTPSWS